MRRLASKQLIQREASSKFRNVCIRGARNSLMNEPKNEEANANPVQASQGPAAKAQKVRSSRYEWEGKSNENEKAAGISSVSRRSLLSPVRALVKKILSGNRNQGNRGFFDNDDDASPSAA
ncbi:MAG: hypothetical protein ACXV5J_07015 [Candidatus Angelobacter sp.]